MVSSLVQWLHLLPTTFSVVFCRLMVHLQPYLQLLQAAIADVCEAANLSAVWQQQLWHSLPCATLARMFLQHTRGLRRCQYLHDKGFDGLVGLDAAFCMPRQQFYEDFADFVDWKHMHDQGSSSHDLPDDEDDSNLDEPAAAAMDNKAAVEHYTEHIVLLGHGSIGKHEGYVSSNMDQGAGGSHKQLVRAERIIHNIRSSIHMYTAPGMVHSSHHMLLRHD